MTQDKRQTEIDDLINIGDQLYRDGKYMEADAVYLKAFRSLNEPKLLDYRGVEIGVCRADCRIKVGDFHSSSIMLKNLINQNNSGFLNLGTGIGYIYLRYSLSEWKLGNVTIAKKYVGMAIKVSGQDIIKDENWVSEII